MKKALSILGARWFQFALIPVIVFAWFWWTDPSGGADTLLRVQLRAQLAASFSAEQVEAAIREKEAQLASAQRYAMPYRTPNERDAGVASERVRVQGQELTEADHTRSFAAIEAARAGEHGKGFAVVAAEIGRAHV